jgi:hypothetical protein
MRQHSITEQELAWAGLDFKEGYAEGTFIQEARAKQSWSMKATGMGGIVRVYDPDRSGTITLTVDAESQLHQHLLAIAALDRLSRNQVFPGLLTDNSTGAQRLYKNMFILSDPDEARATEAGTIQWVFGAEAIEPVPNINLNNVVGA